MRSSLGPQSPMHSDAHHNDPSALPLSSTADAASSGLRAGAASAAGENKAMPVPIPNIMPRNMFQYLPWGKGHSTQSSSAKREAALTHETSNGSSLEKTRILSPTAAPLAKSLSSGGLNRRPQLPLQNEGSVHGADASRSPTAASSDAERDEHRSVDEPRPSSEAVARSRDAVERLSGEQRSTSGTVRLTHAVERPATERWFSSGHNPRPLHGAERPLDNRRSSSGNTRHVDPGGQGSDPPLARTPSLPRVGPDGGRASSMSRPGGASDQLAGEPSALLAPDSSEHQAWVCRDSVEPGANPGPPYRVQDPSQRPWDPSRGLGPHDRQGSQVPPATPPGAGPPRSVFIASGDPVRSLAPDSPQPAARVSGSFTAQAPRQDSKPNSSVRPPVAIIAHVRL